METIYYRLNAARIGAEKASGGEDVRCVVLPRAPRAGGPGKVISLDAYRRAREAAERREPEAPRRPAEEASPARRARERRARRLAAADLLKEQGINVTAADINILYGKDPSEILKAMGKSQQLFTVEDHNINGGLGSYISRLACENQPAKVTRIALTTYGESGPAKELADAYGFSPEAIAAKVKETLGK